MTPAEVRAWFLGYTEGIIADRPTAVQWERIKEMIKKMGAGAYPPELPPAEKTPEQRQQEVINRVMNLSRSR